MVDPRYPPTAPLPGEQALTSLGLDLTQPRPATSEQRFPDGGAFRLEIPSVEGMGPLSAVVAEAERLGVTLHRVSQGSGVMMLSDGEIDDMVALCQERHLELSLFLGPRGTWDIGGAVRAPAGGGGPRARGRDQLGQAVAESARAAEHGVPCVLVADEGVLWCLHRLRAKGDLPPDLSLKVSALAGPSNPASFLVLEGLGADSINIPSDLTVAQVAELRAAGSAAIDFYLEAPEDLGGFVRPYDAPELVRVGAPIYLKFGLRNHPPLYPVGGHLRAMATELARERVRRAALCLELLERAGLADLASPPGSRAMPAAVRFPVPAAGPEPVPTR